MKNPNVYLDIFGSYYAAFSPRLEGDSLIPHPNKEVLLTLGVSFPEPVLEEGDEAPAVPEPVPTEVPTEAAAETPVEQEVAAELPVTP